jgi:hypothetical protein
MACDCAKAFEFKMQPEALVADLKGRIQEATGGQAAAGGQLSVCMHTRKHRVIYRDACVL